MGHSLSVMVAMRSPHMAAQLKSTLANVNGYRFETFSGGLQEAANRIAGESRIDVVVVDLALNDQAELSGLTHLIENCAAQTAVVATSTDANLDDVRNLMRIGVADYLPQPIASDDLIAALDTLASRIRSLKASSGEHGLVYSFIKSCGGMGSTTLAIQTACSLLGQRRPKADVLLCDLDLQFGNAALSLDINSKRGLLDILQAVDRFDAGFLQGVVTAHESGINVLPGPSEIVPLDFMKVDLAERLIELARAEYDYVVFDMPQAWTQWSALILEKSDVIVLVTQFTVPAIRLARRQIDTLRQHNIDKDRIFVVANRFNKSWAAGVHLKQAEKALGHSIGHFVANEYKTVSAAQNQGVPIKSIQRRCKVVKQIGGLVEASLQSVQQTETRSEPA